MYSLIFKSEPSQSQYSYKNVMLESNLVETDSEYDYKIYKPKNQKSDVLAVKNYINKDKIKILDENSNVIETTFYDFVKWSSNKHIDICTRRYKTGEVKVICKGSKKIIKEVSSHTKGGQVINIDDIDVIDERIYIESDNISINVIDSLKNVDAQVCFVSDSRDGSSQYSYIEYIKVDIN